MHKVSIAEAETQLSNLVDAALRGEDVVIARAGKPQVKLVPVETLETVDAYKPAVNVSRFGFMEGQVQVPDDFDTMFQEEIEEMFYGKK